MRVRPPFFYGPRIPFPPLAQERAAVNYAHCPICAQPHTSASTQATSDMNTASYYYPVDVPPLELPASQTCFPTLQPAGAFLKQMQSPYGSINAAQTHQQQQLLKSAQAGGAASPTSPSSVAVASSFLASIRRGLEDLVDDDDDDEDDSDDDDDDEEDASTRYYSASNNNTYYSPPSSFGTQPTATKSPSLFSTSSALLNMMASRNPQQANDDDLIFDMEM